MHSIFPNSAPWLNRRVVRCLLGAWLALNPPAWTAAQDGVPTPVAGSARQTFQRLLEEKRYEEAVTIAKQIVDLNARVHGERSIEVAGPLADLAAAQLRRGDIPGAEGNYQASIAIIERVDGVASPRLVGPLTGLGDTYREAGLHAQAADSYSRALRASHATDGFYNLDQVPILDGLSDSYLALDRLPEANARQRYQVAIQKKRHGPDSPETVQAIYKLARWYNRTGQFEAAHESYRLALRAIGSSDASEPAVVDALTGEAVTYLNEGNAAGSISVLKRALKLLDAQPAKDPLKRAAVLVDLGDVYTLTRQEAAARQRYAEAWKELDGDASLLAERERYFGQPSRIAGPRLPEFVGAGGTDIAVRRAGGAALTDGHVLASLTVQADGTARDAVIVESDPPRLLDERLLRTLKDTAFRPRMQDGEPVATEGVQYRHAFRYERGAAAGARDDPGAERDKDEPLRYPGDDGDDEPQR